MLESETFPSDTGFVKNSQVSLMYTMNSIVSFRTAAWAAMVAVLLLLSMIQLFTAVTIKIQPETVVPKSTPSFGPTASPTVTIMSTALEQCPPYMLQQIPGVNIQDSTLTKAYTFYSTRWGNVLSPYWAARAMAELGGYQYAGAAFGEGTWMELLPTHADAPSSTRPARFVRACQCGESFVYFHRCNFGWGEIFATIRTDTRMALSNYSTTRPIEERDAYEKLFQPNDWLIYERCCILCHSEHGFGGLRTYDSIPAQGEENFTIFTLTQNQIDEEGNEGMGLCHRLHEEAMQSIRRRNPNVQIVALENAEMWVDYARIVYAPNLLVPSAGSSWTLWALLANDGNVVTVPMQRNMDVSVYPKNVEVLTDAGVLYPDTDDLTVGVRNDIIAETTEGRAKIIQWFLTH
jgi:hypothetical protein